MKESCRCIGPARALCDTVASLMPFYSDERKDRPDALLSDYPNPAKVVDALDILVDSMFPGRVTPGDVDARELSIFLTRRLSQGWRTLRPEIQRALPLRALGAASGRGDELDVSEYRAEADRLVKAFLAKLPKVRQLLVADVQAAYDGDPAALTYAEVQLAYPGILAVASHRLAHELYLLDIPVVPRIMSEHTHSKTGVDIHPGARIGHGFFIDHATGVVIGETCEIGDHVKIYQGVTLGARSFPLDENGKPIKSIKRHPTVCDRVVIYANATILGGDTVIGEGSTIGGNVFLMESVPENSFVANEHPELRIKQVR